MGIMTDSVGAQQRANELLEKILAAVTAPPHEDYGVWEIGQNSKPGFTIRIGRGEGESMEAWFDRQAKALEKARSLRDPLVPDAPAMKHTGYGFYRMALPKTKEEEIRAVVDGLLAPEPLPSLGRKRTATPLTGRS